MKRRISLKTLYDMQIGNKLELEGLDNEEDVVKASICIMATRLAQLIPKFAMPLSDKTGKSKGLDVKDIISNLAIVMDNLMLLCNTANFDFPDDEVLEDFEKDIPYEIRKDAIMTVLCMIASIAELGSIVYVDLEGPVWSQEWDEGPETDDFEDAVSAIILGIKHLGEKYGFTTEDVMTEIG